MNAPVLPAALPPGDPALPGAVVTMSSQAPIPSLTEALMSGRRFVALTGEPGVSRSAVVDGFAIGMVEAGVGLIRVRNTAPGPLGVSRLVALIVGGRVAGGSHGIDDELQQVVAVLTAPCHRGKRLVFLIEDAESLDRPALAMLRLLPDLPRAGSPPAQVVLVGRGGLWTLLAEPAQSSGEQAAGEQSAEDRNDRPATLAASGPDPGAGEVGSNRASPLPPSFDRGVQDDVGEVFAPFAPPRAARHRPTALLACFGGSVVIALLAYHAFYRGLPFRPASQPVAVTIPTAGAPATPQQPATPAYPQPSPPAPASAPQAEAKPPTSPPPPLPDKLRQDFDAFLLSQGGDVARLSEADRRELFNQYLSRRAGR